MARARESSLRGDGHASLRPGESPVGLSQPSSQIAPGHPYGSRWRKEPSMPCAGCGAATSGNAAYCGSCGRPVGARTASTRAAGTPLAGTQPAYRPQPRPSHLPPGSSPADLASEARRGVERSARRIVSAVRRRPARAALIGAVALGAVVLSVVVVGVVVGGGARVASPARTRARSPTEAPPPSTSPISVPRRASHKGAASTPRWRATSPGHRG